MSGLMYKVKVDLIIAFILLMCSMMQIDAQNAIGSMETESRFPPNQDPDKSIQLEINGYFFIFTKRDKMMSLREVQSLENNQCSQQDSDAYKFRARTNTEARIMLDVVGLLRSNQLIDSNRKYWLPSKIQENGNRPEKHWPEEAVSKDLLPEWTEDSRFNTFIQAKNLDRLFEIYDDEKLNFICRQSGNVQRSWSLNYPITVVWNNDGQISTIFAPPTSSQEPLEGSQTSIAFSSSQVSSDDISPTTTATMTASEQNHNEGNNEAINDDTNNSKGNNEFTSDDTNNNEGNNEVTPDDTNNNKGNNEVTPDDTNNNKGNNEAIHDQDNKEGNDEDTENPMEARQSMVSSSGYTSEISEYGTSTRQVVSSTIDVEFGPEFEVESSTAVFMTISPTATQPLTLSPSLHIDTSTPIQSETVTFASSIEMLSSTQNTTNEVEQRTTTPTKRHQTTTGGPITTTNGPNTTTSGPITTTNGPNTTTSGPITTTNGPNTTTSGPITTTNSSNNSSNNSAETTATPTTCPCTCPDHSSISDIKNMTQEVIEELTQAIQKNLTVDTSSLSSTIRKKTSAYDSRKSSQVTGMVGIAFLVLTFGSVVLMDLLKLLQFLVNRLVICTKGDQERRRKRP